MKASNLLFLQTKNYVKIFFYEMTNALGFTEQSKIPFNTYNNTLRKHLMSKVPA